MRPLTKFLIAMAASMWVIAAGLFVGTGTVLPATLVVAAVVTLQAAAAARQDGRRRRGS